MVEKRQWNEGPIASSDHRDCGREKKSVPKREMKDEREREET